MHSSRGLNHNCTHYLFFYIRGRLLDCCFVLSDLLAHMFNAPILCVSLDIQHSILLTIHYSEYFLVVELSQIVSIAAEAEYRHAGEMGNLPYNKVLPFPHLKSRLALYFR